MSLPKELNTNINLLMTMHDDSNNEIKREILHKIKILVLADNPKHRTQSSRFSLIKKKFKSISNDKLFLKEIRPEKNITDKIIEDNAQIRDDRKLISITKDMIQKILSLEKTNDAHNLAIYLLFVSGRRTSELLEADFMNIKKSRLVRIRGIKKRTDNIDCDFVPLINKTKFFKLLKKFKKMQKLSNVKTFHRTLNRKVKFLLGKNAHPHLLRGMYITYLFKFRNVENKKINTFIRDNLCHQSINASLNYTQYKIDDLNKDFVK